MTKPVYIHLLFMCLATAAVNSSAQSAKSNDLFEKILKEEAGASDETAKEILAIRKRLGGLELELAQDQPQPSDADDTKTKKTNRKKQQQWPAAGNKSNGKKRGKRNGQQTSKDDRQQIQRHRESVAAKAISSVNGVARFRAIARQMDALAADLEDLDLYPDADAVRGHAAKIRQLVRKFKRD